MRTGGWQILGSDLLAFTAPDSATVSLRLQDIEEKLSQRESLDLYLENTMAGVKETAICYHNRGFVQSYQVRSLCRWLSGVVE